MRERSALSQGTVQWRSGGAHCLLCRQGRPSPWVHDGGLDAEEEEGGWFSHALGHDELLALHSSLLSAATEQHGSPQ